MLNGVALAQPIRGYWPWLECPDSVPILGSVFNRAQIEWPFYANVRAQYREAVPRYSRHLMIYFDGTFVVDHVDEYNPDFGLAAAHWGADVPLGAKLAGALVVGVIALALFANQRNIRT